ncbi:MAG: glutamine-hydrolyzing carbamoyl-phosphate synthase small subunit [Treponema sp.]|uniref:glutamine-hydrolyzing carbamoyl-phosphate synthase small subunit n=1 Tax=Treponema sp. TaxID=166 RepID=UPI00298DC1AF|nr:glutamine-hydrolyzing carbamoyl-phosphate synthase small subunit [Treponema sp.]MDD5811561.1 glutamine-hydrolyzing carbamoyl-phosphate synthase small subunit [Treponema sp.]
MSKAFLVLADGTVFEGTSIGAEGSTIGETVFTTGMTGYLETLTDPSYFGQIVTQTFPLIGNYGVIPEDFESRKCFVKGYIVRELCSLPSNFRCQSDLDSYLKSQNIVGIAEIDTRALTKKLRESGVMNGMIISGIEKPVIENSLLEKIKAYRVDQSVETVSTSTQLSEKQNVVKDYPEINHHIFHSDKQIKILLWDFGAKYNIPRELEKRNAEVITVPYSYTTDDILKLDPDGIMLSNGPGDPADNTGVIAEIAKLVQYNIDAQASGKKMVPIFGICLGHQLLALARGCKTSKLKYGHRGGNHPVKEVETGRVFITSQNHGYAVQCDNLPSFAKLAFYNSNDKTCEGITYTDIPAFSVQFHPEACGGPHDTNFLFDKFIQNILTNKEAK